MFKPVDSKLDFPKMEHSILEFWKETDAFNKLREKNRGRERWSFIDGPITANNPMGVHHGWGRTLKDIYIRYKAMLGYDQRYQNGFDCQGLWVEVEVEKDLGLSKRDIEQYGLDNFARACRERVLTYADRITQQSIRLGQWMDWENSYFTMSDTNNEYIWYFLAKCQENGWLYRGLRSMPWCWRCGTSLSQHEMLGTDSYREVTHKSVFLKFPITTPGHEGENLLVWTTTPWTLTANVAAAVHPDLDYAKVKQGDDIYYLSRGTLGLLVGDYEDLGSVKGSALVGLTYRGPFDELNAVSNVEHKVIPWEAVGEEEGTGIVHIAPGCGAEDFELSKQFGLSVLVPIDEGGNYTPKYDRFAGKHVTEVAPIVFDSLKEKGLLYRLMDFTHRYPVCWRCSTDLVFRVATEWYISAEKIRPRMLRAAREVEWIPEYGGKRMENWLENMGDWNISRKRYWGLVLPFYVCDCGEVTVARSRANLREMAVNPEVVDALPELHRPWVDEVKINCPKCGGTVSRIPEVGDAWLDAGIVAFSTMGYLDNHDYWEKWFPANLVSEMREQIRLWFYSMLFMSVTLEDTSPYETVVMYEKVHDEHGRPMHKSWGNAIWFDDAAEKMGADVMRWMYASANTTQNMNFGFGIADEVKRNLLTLWNTYSFFVMYANLDGYDPSEGSVPVAERSEIDRWILARLHELIGVARSKLDVYDATGVTRAVDAFVDDLSNWYVRLSRRRFWKSESDADKLAAYSTLYEVLVTLTKLIAPIMPFLAEEMYQNLVGSRVRDEGRDVAINHTPTPAPYSPLPASVHHCDYPVADESMIDHQLLVDTALTQQVVSLGRSARNKFNLKVRQPLRSITVRPTSKADEAALKRVEAQILSELNVKKMEITSDVGDLIHYVIKPNLPLLGPKYGQRLGAIRAWLSSADPAAIAAQVESEQPIALKLDGGEAIELLPTEVLVETQEKEGFAVAQEGGLVVALDTELDATLLQEGLARELVRTLNDMRKAAGFDISDRVVTYYNLTNDGTPEDLQLVNGALANFADYIRAETLSTDLASKDAPADAYTQEEKIGSATLRLGVQRPTSSE